MHVYAVSLLSISLVLPALDGGGFGSDVLAAVGGLTRPRRTRRGDSSHQVRRTSSRGRVDRARRTGRGESRVDQAARGEGSHMAKRIKIRERVYNDRRIGS